MTDAQFSAAYKAALTCEDHGAYLSGLADNLAEDELEKIWNMAHLTVKDIRVRTGLSQASFAQRHLLPRRTVENWESGVNTCPEYTKLLLAKVEGLL